MKKTLDFLTAKPARFFLFAALIWGGFICYLNSKDVGENGFNWHDILVEANGMVFDLFVFGILLSVYESLREKRGAIERLIEEIDDYREWDEKEATYRIAGAVRRLNKRGVTKIHLTACFLSNASLQGVDLSGSFIILANLSRAKLHGSKLSRVNLMGANLSEADLSETDLSRADLSGANLSGANLSGANLSGADLSEANLSGTNLSRTNLLDVDLSGTNLFRTKLLLTGVSKEEIEKAQVNRNYPNQIAIDNWLLNLEKWKVIGWEDIALKYQVNKNGKLQLK